MNYSNIAKQADKMAANAKPGIMKINGKTYTFVFDHNEWVYKVYEDLFYFTSYNTKSIKQAKAWLKDYFNN